MKIHAVLIAYALDVRPLVSAIWSPDLTLHLFLHSKREDVVLSCRDIFRYTPNVRYYDYGINRGLAKSWNEGIFNAHEQGADAIVVINDDVVTTKEGVALLAQGCVDHPRAGIIEGEGYNERMNEYQILQFACFGINPIALDKVGYFDENYLVIYGEDVDYSRRCNLAGIVYHNVGPTGMVHRGSTTIATVPELYNQNQTTFPRNENYHRRKHGGGYNQEVFEHPFNDPALSWFIGAENRDNPYPEHRRTDADEVVKI